MADSETAPARILARMSFEEKKIIIGLDFGTTFSGVAYCDSSRGTDDVNSIQLVTSWPGMASSTNEKVPTRICYKPDGEVLWGNQIKPTEKGEVHALMKLQLDGKPMSSKKLQLLIALLTNRVENVDLNDLDSDDDDEDGTERKTKKDPVDIVADYLTQVREFVYTELKKEYDDGLFSTLSKQLIVTVPAVWSERAKDQTLKAVTKSNWGAAKVSLVTEPEAAAIYTLKWMTTGANKEQINNGDSFVLCDAGGGTVDLISYQITQTLPSFKVEEATVGSGDKCGATYVDKEFMTWLEGWIGTDAFKKIPGDKIRHGSPLMNQFEKKKEHFSGVEDEMEVLLPRQCGITDDSAKNIDDGHLILTTNQMKQFFEPCIKRTLELIDGQVTSITDAGKPKPRMVLVVGGFGRNEYVFNRIDEYCKQHGIVAKRPAFPWSAVARGAVCRGLEGPESGLVEVRLARKHYGTFAGVLFDPKIHDPEDRYVDKMTSMTMARGQMSWLVDRGERLPEHPQKKVSIELCCRFEADDDRMFGAVLAGCDLPAAPKRYYDSNVYNVCRVQADLSSVPEHKFTKYRAGLNGTEFLVAEFKLEATFGGSMIEWQFIFDGKSYGSVSVSYDK